MNSLTTSKRREIIHFFEDLTHRMKNNLLSQEEEQRMTECYLSYLYSSNSSYHSNSNHSEKENLKKYLVMGWYVYHTVNNGDNSNNSDNSDN
jgi:hypothetical protein